MLDDKTSTRTRITVSWTEVHTADRVQGAAYLVLRKMGLNRFLGLAERVRVRVPSQASCDGCSANCGDRSAPALPGLPGDPTPRGPAAPPFAGESSCWRNTSLRRAAARRDFKGELPPAAGPPDSSSSAPSVARACATAARISTSVWSADADIAAKPEAMRSRP